jgi:hypothetical protein
MRGSATKRTIGVKSRVLSTPKTISADFRPDSPTSAAATDRTTLGTPRIDISNFEFCAPTPHVLADKPTSHIKISSRILGVLGTVLVHGIALNYAGWGTAAHKVRPRETQGIGSVRVETHAPPSEELVLLNLALTQKGDSDLARSIASLIPPSIKLPIEVVSPEPLTFGDDSDMGGATNLADVGDPAVRALMAGHYRGQISARIERAWVRPRTPVKESIDEGASAKMAVEAPFSCQVQIRQDAQGNVEEVLLLSCDGTEAWRHSLIVAINQASPLPAPPIPSVFSHSITLSFRAEAYLPGSAPDDYERARPDIAQASPPSTSRGAPARLPNMGVAFGLTAPK